MYGPGDPKPEMLRQGWHHITDPRAGATTSSGTMLNAGTAARRATHMDVGGSARTWMYGPGDPKPEMLRHG